MFKSKKVEKSFPKYPNGKKTAVFKFIKAKRQKLKQDALYNVTVVID